MRKLVKKIVGGAAVAGVLGGLAFLAGLHTYKYYKFYTKPEVVEIDPVDEIMIVGPIEDLSPQLIEMRKLVREGKKEILLNINSPGGRLDTTEIFVRFMEAAQKNDVEITCVVTGLAASAATIILSKCDNRYALFGTGILWHSLLTGGFFVLNESSTAEILGYIQAKNEEIWADTRKYFYPWYFVEHFVNESLLLASEVEDNGFGFVSVIRELKYTEIERVYVEPAVEPEVEPVEAPKEEPKKEEPKKVPEDKPKADPEKEEDENEAAVEEEQEMPKLREDYPILPKEEEGVR